MDSFTSFKKNNGFQYRLQPFINILAESDNVILIKNTLKFINVLMAKNDVLLIEFQDSCQIETFFEKIIQKIKNGEYSIVNCSYEDQQKRIQKSKNENGK